MLNVVKPGTGSIYRVMKWTEWMFLKCNVFGVSVSVMYKTRLDYNHSEYIGLCTELIRWHCLGVES